VKTRTYISIHIPTSHDWTLKIRLLTIQKTFKIAPKNPQLMHKFGNKWRENQLLDCKHRTIEKIVNRFNGLACLLGLQYKPMNINLCEFFASRHFS
jgi:hypothetical protein